MSTALDRLDALLSSMDEKQAAELDVLLAKELSKPWLPTPGPQLEAYLSEADLLLFGGSAGGGKTDLICGLCLNEHERSVIFRSQSKDLDGFWERLCELAQSPKSQNSVMKKLVTADDRLVEGGHLEKPGSENSWQGRPHDFIGFDEGAQLTAYKVKFVLGWLRSAKAKRCRAVIASNPPIGGEGAWLLEWFAPWLDPLFANPAKPGELRWAVAVGDKNEIKTVWCDRPDPVEIEGQVQIPLSRTFIPSRLDDNPYLKETNYRAQLMSMPEPLRSQLLHGDFLAGREDDEWQVIPSEWVKLAQARWKEPAGKKMLALGVDVAQGGADSTVLAPLYEENIFGGPESRAGKLTPDGPSVAGFILQVRRDGAAIAIDTTGGWGGSARDHLATHHKIKVVPIVFSATGSGEAAGWGKDGGTRLGYANLRAKMYWEFRVALDPSRSENISLPPGDRILAQLTAARWHPRSGKIVIESKEEIRSRLGSSPDEADAIVEAWHIRHQAYKKPKEQQHRPEQVPTRLGWMG